MFGLVIWRGEIKGAVPIISSVFAVLSCLGFAVFSSGDMENGKLSFSGGALILLLLFSSGVLLVSSGAFNQTLKNPELETEIFETARAFVFGRTLAERFPFEKAIIIAGLDDKGAAHQKTAIDNILKGFDYKMEVIAVEYVPVEKFDQGRRMRISMKYSANDLNALLDKYPDYTLLISTVGLPPDAQKLKLWNDFPIKKAAIFDGFTRWFGKAVKNGRIVLVSTYRPGWTFFPGQPPDSPDEKFQMRYLLIDSENIEELARKYPGLAAL
jgi:hypothetical protein